jgi:hypothetical protein
MSFSLSDLGFWRFAVLALVFELTHALLDSLWPGIQGSRLGPRPLAAILFMFAEAIALMLAIVAAIGKATKMLRLPVRPVVQMFAVAAMVLCLIGVFLVVWQR